MVGTRTLGAPIECAAILDKARVLTRSHVRIDAEEGLAMIGPDRELEYLLSMTGFPETVREHIIEELTRVKAKEHADPIVARVINDLKASTESRDLFICVLSKDCALVDNGGEANSSSGLLIEDPANYLIRTPRQMPARKRGRSLFRRLFSKTDPPLQSPELSRGSSFMVKQYLGNPDPRLPAIWLGNYLHEAAHYSILKSLAEKAHKPGWVEAEAKLLTLAGKSAGKSFIYWDGTRYLINNSLYRIYLEATVYHVTTTLVPQMVAGPKNSEGYEFQTRMLAYESLLETLGEGHMKSLFGGIKPANVFEVGIQIDNIIQSVE